MDRETFMKEDRLQVSCPSCETVFEVTDPELIGQIVACPKCGGMMMIAPPEDANPAGGLKETIATDDSSLSSRATVLQDERNCEKNGADLSKDADSENGVLIGAEGETEADGVRAVEANAQKWNAKLPLIASGVICALIAAFFVAFIREYFDPSGDAAAERANARQLGERGNDVAASSDEEEASPALPAEEGVDKASEAPESVGGTEKKSELLPGAGEEESLESSDQERAKRVKNSFEDSGDESPNEGSAEESPASVLEEGEVFAGASEEIEPTFGEETDVLDEELDEADEEETNSIEDDALPTEFDEKEFERENQAIEEKEESEEDLGSVASTTDLSLQNALPALRSEPKQIDVDARLALKFRSIVLPDSPAAAIRLISEFSGVPICFDLERFSLLRPSLGARLDLRLDDVSVGEVLEKVVNLLKWEIVKEPSRLMIEPQTDRPEETKTQIFDVSDLISEETPFFAEISGNDEPTKPEKITPEALARMATTLAVGLRNENEEGKVSCEDGSLVVDADDATRKDVETLLEQLRALRRLDSSSDGAAKDLIAESFCWETLSQKTSFNLLKPVSLQQATDTLEGKYKFLSLWDDAALNSVGAGRDSSVFLRVDSATIDQVLTSLLDPIGLSYIILGDNLILVTSKEKASSYETVEIHGFAALDEPKAFEEALGLSREMMKTVAPESWNVGRSSIWLDLENGCWIVRQTQPVQREIRRWLDARKNGDSDATSNHEATNLNGDDEDHDRTSD